MAREAVEGVTFWFPFQSAPVRGARGLRAGESDGWDRTAVGTLAADGEDPRPRNYTARPREFPPSFSRQTVSPRAGAGMSHGVNSNGVKAWSKHRRNAGQTERERAKVVAGLVGPCRFGRPMRGGLNCVDRVTEAQ